VLAVNKMDLVDFDRAVFDGIVADYHSFAEALGFDEISNGADQRSGRRQHRRHQRSHALVCGADAAGLSGNDAPRR
jgi:hypothetical protein